MLIQFFHSNINEIKQDKKLQFIGALLALTHFITGIFWIQDGYLKEPAICWPFFESCAPAWNLISAYSEYLLHIYITLSIFSVFLFLKGKTTAGYFLFFGLSLFKYFLHISNFKLMGNYHYMSEIINFVFLLFLDKKNNLRIFLVLFYIGAGLVKFNSDWLSGAALLRPSFLTGKTLELALAYVVLLELILVLLLFSERKWIRWSVVGQLIAFHAYSWHIVGYFYPSIMFCFLPILILYINIPIDFPKTLPSKIATLTFLFLHIYGWLFEKNSSIDGRFRTLTLNMLDAKSICQTTFNLRFKDGKTVEYLPQFFNYGIRIHCDPIIVKAKISETCNYFSKDEHFLDLDVNHQIRRVSDNTTTINFNYQEVCSKPLKANIFNPGYQD